MTRGTLGPTELHPAWESAREWIAAQPMADLLRWQEALASCAIEGNRTGEVCAETMHRILTRQPVSDRYLLGLAWVLRSLKAEDGR